MTNVRPWDMLKGGQGSGKRVSEEVQAARFSICESCPSLKLGICVECGCRMKWKTSLAYASCPLHKWEAENDKEV